MTENKGDLISRSALKEVMKSRLSVCNEWIEKAKDNETKIRASAVKAYIGEVIMTIDNAPTVAYPFEKFRTMLCGTCQANMRIEPERPKGEWIIIDDTEQFIAKCSVCGRIEDSRMVKDYPFCHCGADMRGDESDK